MKTIATRTKLMGGAAVALALAASGAQADIRFWTTETQPERLEQQVKMAADFEAETGIAVEVIPVEEPTWAPAPPPPSPPVTCPT